MAGETREDLLDLAVSIAEKAGDITLKYFQTRLDVETKADMSPVTVADREAEAYIRREIESRFPEDGIIGEEFGESRIQAERRWILDPIDGTFSFVHGVPLYGVLIGVEQGTEPLLGVIRMPALGETVAAATGRGCLRNGEPVQASKTSELKEALWLTTSMTPEADPVKASAIGRVAMASGWARTWGDCYAYVLVATGRADVAIDPLMNVWDCAALLPVIEESGGRFTDWRGERTIRGGNAVATNGLLHEPVLSALAG